MNCIIVDDDAFSRTVIRQYVSRTPHLELVAECASAMEAYNVLKSLEVDIVFLDVEMPEMTGLDLVRALKKMPQIILITAGRQYAVEAFEYSATDYLVKPVDYPRLLKAVDKAEANLQRNLETPPPNNLPTEEPETEKDFFFIKTKADGKITQLRLSEIVYAEALSDYVEICTEKSSYIIHSTMKALESKLPETDFIRVHRSYIINTQFIDSIEGDNIILKLGKVIPVGASYKNNFLKRLNFLT